MAATENGSLISAEEEAKYGFQRPEMHSKDLANTVDAYDRHVFLCYKGPEAWASRVEDSDTDILPKLLSAAVKARKNDTTVKTKLTICGGCDGTSCNDGDVLVFPEMIKYKCLTEANVDQFVDDVFVNGKPWAFGEQEALTGSHIFVCAHGSRDKRCGVCGPALIERLKEEIKSRAMKDQVFVSPCTHIGGHKYAGNLIIYSPDAEGKITGHWYGYVAPDDVPEVLDQHITKGQVIHRLWRGQMGAAPVEEEKPEEQKISNGEKVANKENHQEEEAPPAPVTEEEKKESTGDTGCCQGSANAFSCCREVSSDDKLEKPKEISSSSSSSSSEEPSSKGGSFCKLSCWVGKWEQHEVLTAAAVVGAMATLAVAYSFYKRSSHH